MKKDKVNKTQIIIEQEVIGKAVCQKKHKEKKNDLTKDINIFLEGPKNIDSIKNIILRIEGRYFSEKPGIINIKIFGLKLFEGEKNAFLITVKYPNYLKFTYYLTSNTMHELRNLAPMKICTSFLKQQCFRAIWEWFREHPEYVKIIE